MSLQQAAALTQNPILKGLQAGQSAYNSPLATSIEASLNQAQQQRAQLGLNPASSYPLTDTSAAAYQYLHGQGPYPYQPVTKGPITVPYEQAHGITGPTSQASLAQQAKDAPWRGTSESPESTVQTKPSAGSSMLAMALPAAIAYKYLMPADMKAAIADKTGLDILGPSAKEAATTGTTAGTTAGASAAAAPASASFPESASAYEGYGPTEYQYGAMGEAPTMAPTATQYGAFGEAPGAVAAAPTAGLEYAMNPTDVYKRQVYNPVTGALTGATEAQIAAASVPTVAEGASAIEAANAAQAANEYAMAADAAAGAEGAGLMAIDPYTAGLAALLAMTPGGQNILGKMTGVIGGIAGGIGDLAGSALGTVTNAVGDVASGIGDAIGSGVQAIGDFFGFAEGGEIRGISDAYALSKKYQDGGDVKDDDTEQSVRAKPAVAQTNKFGQLLDSVVASRYKQATDAGDVAKANAYKQEIEYRKRMKGYQQQFAAGGLLTPQGFNLGGYSDGGRLLRGPGDGVSDSIPATIGHKQQPARLADGEFVVPARIVSELGNGSTEAGARKLYAMMDRIQADRKKSVGKGKVAVNSRADKHLPA